MVRRGEPIRRFKRYTIFLLASVLAVDSADRATVPVTA
jgi:hypothetical protein